MNPHDLQQQLTGFRLLLGKLADGFKGHVTDLWSEFAERVSELQQRCNALIAQMEETRNRSERQEKVLHERIRQLAAELQAAQLQLGKALATTQEAWRKAALYRDRYEMVDEERRSTEKENAFLKDLLRNGNRAEPEVFDLEDPSECPACHEPNLIFMGDTWDCLYCKTRFKADMERY